MVREEIYRYDDNGVDKKEHLMTSYYDSDNIRQVLNKYDSKGRVIEQIDGNGNKTTINYYEDRTVVVDSEGIEEVYILDSKLRTNKKVYGTSEVEYEKIYSEESRVESRKDGNGVETVYEYDDKGNVIRERKSDGEYTISREYSYDEKGNKIKETDYKGNETNFIYDSKNNLTKVIYANGSYEEIAYDNLSRVISKNDRNGNITRYSYIGMMIMEWIRKNI